MLAYTRSNRRIRRKCLALCCVCSLVVVLCCSVLLMGRSSSSSDLPSDYVLHAAQHDDVIRSGPLDPQVHLARRMVAVQDNNNNNNNNEVFNSKSRSRQSHNGEIVHDNPEAKRKVSNDLPLQRVVNGDGHVVMRIRVDNAPSIANNPQDDTNQDIQNLVIEDDGEDEEEDDEEYDYANPVFKQEDFDKSNITTRPVFKFSDIKENVEADQGDAASDYYYDDEQDGEYENNDDGDDLKDDAEKDTNQKSLLTFKATYAQTSDTSKNKDGHQRYVQGGNVRARSDRPCISIYNCPRLQKQDAIPKDSLPLSSHGDHLQQDRILLDSLSHRPFHVVAMDTSALGAKQHKKLLISGAHQDQSQTRKTREHSLHNNNIPQTSDRKLSRNPPIDLHLENIRTKIETQIPIQADLSLHAMADHKPATQIQMPELPWQPGEVRSEKGVPLVVDKVFWSKEVEQLVPPGVTEEGFQHFLYQIESLPVREMHAPTWNRCGRPKNQYVVLEDGTPLCARYRHPHNKLVQGEVLSFYLSRILGLDNIPIVILANTSAPQWQGHNLSEAEWKSGQVVALIQWVHELDMEKSLRSRVKMPPVLLDAYENRTTFTINSPTLPLLSANQLSLLLQWSDLILFDYLTGHYDRVASMQDGADRENKPSIMHENIRNLRQVWQSNKLWFIDNESGLLDAYELMFHGHTMGRKFVDFHDQMLRTNCVFHRQTVEKIYALANLQDPDRALEDYARRQDPLYKHVAWTDGAQKLFHIYFHKRLKEVVAWIEECKARR